MLSACVDINAFKKYWRYLILTKPFLHLNDMVAVIARIFQNFLNPNVLITFLIKLHKPMGK